MRVSPTRQLRCAIYTRKSTEHGLELEFNSLHAQRDACEAYIKSQSSQGWKVLPQQYDDAAFSGGNMERPALKRLLADIEANRVDIIVVYKIDRLTRSLADFAKLVELFDAKSISFVAVTQQFNTTSSMGRLTLNVLLSFAQFERELSSERVRDKIAASRIKGRWTGGTVPLGYEAINKKLVIHKKDANAVRTIFNQYLKLKSFGALVTDLDARGVVSRKSASKANWQRGIPLTYGPLAHILKNRVYLGEIGYRGKWYDGDHEPIIDGKVFDDVQKQLEKHAIERKAKTSRSGALLMGKLFDDRGNRMSPSFTVKNGVRYRFYVSTALLRGRKAEAGSVTRATAQDVEGVVERLLRKHIRTSTNMTAAAIMDHVDRAVLESDKIVVHLRQSNENGKGKIRLEVKWSKVVKDRIPYRSPVDPASNDKLISAIVKANYWLRLLSSGKYSSIEKLGAAIKVQPKTIRQGIKCAFLAPDIVESVFNAKDDHQLPCPTAMIDLPLDWQMQKKLFELA